MGDLKEIGKRFEKIKKEFGYTNQQLGEICGVSYTAIGNIVNGITLDPSVGLFVKLAIKLDISVEWLVLGKGEMLKSASKKNQPDALKFLKQENQNLKNLISAREGEISTLKRILTLLEEQSKKTAGKKKVS